MQSQRRCTWLKSILHNNKATRHSYVGGLVVQLSPTIDASEEVKVIPFSFALPLCEVVNHVRRFLLLIDGWIVLAANFVARGAGVCWFVTHDV